MRLHKGTAADSWVFDSGSGGVAIGKVLPGEWEQPIMRSEVVRAHAQTSLVPEQFEVAGTLGVQTPGTAEDTGQDSYQFAVPFGKTEFTITATPDGFLDIELFLYAPGAVGPGQTNLLTNNPLGLTAAGVGGIEGTTVTVSSAGTYTIAIEDDRAAAQQVAGQYTISVVSNKPLGSPTPVNDEGPESD